MKSFSSLEECELFWSSPENFVLVLACFSAWASGEVTHDWFNLLYITSCFRFYDAGKRVVMTSRGDGSGAL